MLKIKKLNNFQVNVRIEKVLSYLKYTRRTEIDANIKSLILEEIQEVYVAIEPFAMIRIEDQVEFLYQWSDDVKKLLLNSAKTVVFAVTLGINFDIKIEKFLEDRQILKATIWDSIGSEAVEQCANYVNEYIRKKALLDDYLTTKRYSAGYGDWHVQSNIEIIKYLEPENITVNKEGMLTPQKTITAIFGLEPRF
ncbi:MAG: hypothetical protein GY817_01805 [bacterium]|nr:hypothetical protein [bacterium]